MTAATSQQTSPPQPEVGATPTLKRPLPQSSDKSSDSTPPTKKLKSKEILKYLQQ